QVVLEWNRTEARYPHVNVLNLFEAQAAQSPDAVALVFEDSQLTYAGLNQQASQLAHYLRRLGVGLDVRVGLCTERNPEMVLALLAILKAGGAYVPLDPGYPPERLSYMVQHTQMPLLLAQQSVLDGLSIPGVTGISLQTAREVMEGESKANLNERPAAENLAYILFTSGSTGKPKGVAVEHRQLQSYVQAVVDRLELNGRMNFALVQPLTVDSSVTTIFGALCTGGTLHIIPREKSLDAGALAEYFEQHRIDYLKCAPSHLAALHAADGEEKILPQRCLVIGGEASKSEWVQHLRSILPATCSLFNHYGPTETTVGVLTHRIELQYGNSPGVTLVGRPLGNTRAYVLDDHGQPTPVGVRGELYIGGANVVRGYWNGADLTAEKFVPDAWSGGWGERLYGTGDQVRYDASGNIEYLGRRDEQVKIRGNRIELGEIETVLLEQEEVDQCVAVVREVQGGEKRLFAYIVAKPGADESGLITRLREHAKRKLPEFMVPSAYALLESLPLSEHGKLDRKRLPEVKWDADEKSAETGDVRPRGPEEEILCGIWEAVLGVERVGIHDNFFRLGGHSLLAMQVIARVRSNLGVEVPLRKLFEEQTPATFAESVRAARQAGRDLGPALERVGREGALPLSYAQQRLWFLDQLSPNSAAYNMPLAVRLIGELNREALEKSLQAIVGRHEVLHSSFVMQDNNPVQQVLKEFSLQVETIEAGGEGTEREKEVRRLVREEACGAFDLRQGPLVRVKLVRLQEQEHVLLVTMHHIVSDGWSMAIMVREFEELYTGYAEGREPQLAELPIQYGDYAVWQRKWLQGEVLEKQIEYWRKELAGVEVLELPTDRKRPAVMSERGARQRVGIGREVLEKLQKLSREEGVTLFMTLLGGFQVLLWRYSGQEDIAVGTPIAGRTRTETSGLIGCFVNTLVVRTKLEKGQEFVELLRQVRERTLGGYEHQDVPFEKLVEELQPERDLSRQPIFQVMFGLQNLGLEGEGSRGEKEEEQRGAGGLRVEGLEGAEEEVASKFDLMLLVWESERGIRGTVEYNRELFERGTVERMMRGWELVLEQVGEDGGRRISGIRLLSEAEEREVERGYVGEEEEESGEGVGRS
ncbi:MAG TPA: amino acid adenylation domain-containing protein, partial [Candidatus Angelobacter sp.]|nr:amino acid adenylation domain-containing protein [Candidatus Angelobacter sp.]